MILVLQDVFARIDTNNGRSQTKTEKTTLYKHQDSLNSKLKKASEKRARLIDRAVDGAITKGELGERTRQLDRESDAIRSKPAEIDTLIFTPANTASISNLLTQIIDCIPIVGMHKLKRQFGDPVFQNGLKYGSTACIELFVMPK